MSTKLMPVAFDGDALNLIDLDGEPMVALRSIADALGLSWSPQTDKLRSYQDRWKCAAISTVAEDGKLREMWAMPLKKLPAYLYSISPGKVAPHVRPKLERYQAECDEVLWRHWQNRGVREVDSLMRGLGHRGLAEFDPAPATPAETRLDHIEHHLDRMASGMAELVEVSRQQAQKMELSSRYIALLELNQRGKVRVTPEIERQVFEMKAEGMANADIARLLRISPPTVGQLLKGYYPRNAELKDTQRPDLEQIIEQMVEQRRLKDGRHE